MGGVTKALWYIENKLTGDLDLDRIAEMAGLSKFHLVRAFTYTAGRPVMRYVRGRRLSEAAKDLARGKKDILGVAIAYGYGSHEAFSRAFRDQFGVTPSTVINAASLEELPLVQPQRIDVMTPDRKQTPDMRRRGEFLLAGVNQRYDGGDIAGIPAQWQRFVPHFGHIDGQKGDITYGVCWNFDMDANMDYLCAVEVDALPGEGAELTGLKVAPALYAVFRHDDHISTVGATWKAIMTDWLPASGHAFAMAPQFERYGPDFDAQTGEGGLEIWIPVKED